MAKKNSKKPTTSEEAREIIKIKKLELIDAQADFRRLLALEKR